MKSHLTPTIKKGIKIMAITKIKKRCALCWVELDELDKEKITYFYCEGCNYYYCENHMLPSTCQYCDADEFCGSCVDEHEQYCEELD